MDGTLRKLLNTKREQIEEKWLEAIIETYPADTFGVSRKGGSEFTNPVFHTFTKGNHSILNYILGKSSQDTILPSLEMMMKIRAVQEFEASQAVKVIFCLRKIIWDEIEHGGLQNFDSKTLRELLDIESRIDQAGFLAFDLFMKCREKVYELRTTELRNAVHGHRPTRQDIDVPLQT